MIEVVLADSTEPMTFEEICEFIDDTSISTLDKHELKSRIADCLQAERNKGIDDMLKEINDYFEGWITSEEAVALKYLQARAKILKEGAE